MIVHGFGVMSGKHGDCFGRNVGYVSIFGAVASERYTIWEMAVLEEGLSDLRYLRSEPRAIWVSEAVLMAF